MREPWIRFEDEHLLVVAKPSGVNTHRADTYAPDGMYEWVQRQRPHESLSILHRLDKATSGLLVFGRSAAANRSLAVQFAPKGVRSNAILPGPVETPLLMDWLLKDEAAKQLRLARNPSGRFGKPEEIVNMAIYLASDESRWTNGASLVVDGGISVNYF